MSQENVDESDCAELITATYARWNEGEWAEEHFHGDVEWEMSQAAFDQTGPSRGRDSLMDYWRRFWAAWKPGARWEIDELECVSEGQVCACGRLLVVGRSSGLETEVPVFHLWTVRDGLIVRLVVGDDRATLLKAAKE
jgi:ketosteroid isomerase-like protein